MIAMTKYEMVRYLKDYADLQYLMMLYPNQQIGKLFDRLMQTNGRFDNDTREYYDRMRRVYMVYNSMKKFSYIEDFLLNRDNYINDTELDEIIPENTYSTNMGNISKKKLLQLIRNTFNHNNSDDIDRFKISVNGRKIEIELLNGPVRIRFDVMKLLDAYNNMINHRKNSLNISFDIPDDFDINSTELSNELDKIKFVHYYFNSQLSNSMIQQFNRMYDTKNLSKEELIQRSEEFNNLSSSLNPPTKYDLTEEQKNKIISYIDHYKKYYPDLLDEDINNVMYYFLMKVIPVPLVKSTMLTNQILYCERFMEDVNKSLNIVLQEIRQVIRGNNPFDPSDAFDQQTFEMLTNRKQINNLYLYKDCLDGEVFAGFPIITYFDSVITHCCKEEIIRINGVDYNTEKIRNCFAHGRWYITTDNNIMLFDADPRNIHDYNLEFVGKINIKAFEEWINNYVEQNKERINVVKRNY